MPLKNLRLLLVLLPLPALAQQPPALTLRQALAEGLQRNYDILLSRQDAQIAANNVTPGNAGQLPRLTANATRTFNNTNINQRFGDADPRVVNGATSNLLNTNLTLGWTLFDGFGMFIAHDRLRALSQQQQETTRATVEETVEAISNAYFDVVRQTAQVRALTAALAIGQARIDLTQARVDVGVAAKVEVLTARVDYNADRSLLLQQQQGITAAKVALNALLGRAPAQDFRAVDSLVVRRDLQPDSLAAARAARNPRLAAARRAATVAAAERRLARAARYPTLGAVAGYGLTRNINNAAFAGLVLTNSTNQVLGFNYGLTAALPLYGGGNLRRLEQNARLAEVQSQLRLDQTALQLTADATTAFAQYQNYLALLALETDNLALADQNVAIALERYRLGLVAPLVLREAQRSQIAAATRRYDIEYAAKTAETQLLRLSGELVR